MIKTKNIWWGMLIILAVFLRFYNLRVSSRFIWDESSDLVRMADLLARPRLTMVGPISENGQKVFGSLTYYLTLPFVYVFKFDLVSSAYAPAFFSCLTILLTLFVSRKLHLSRWIVALMVVSFPLLEAARWAWNPHFIPFWEMLAIASFLYGTPWGYFLAGLFMGLTVHHHYYGFFAAIGIILMSIFTPSRRFPRGALVTTGLIVALLPFAVFDLTHPPGLFLTRMIFFSPLVPSNGAFNFINILANFVKIPLQFFVYLHGQCYWAAVVTLGLTLVALIRSQKRWLWPVAVQLFCLSFVGGDIFDHYLLPAVIFYYLWLVSNLKTGKIYFAILILTFLTNLWAVPRILFQNDWSTNTNATREIIKIIADQYSRDQSDFNIAVLGSPDPNTKGLRYRDVLRLHHIPVAPAVDYSNVNRVFFISYLDWSELTHDPAYEINKFRQSQPSQSWAINNSRWKVYLLQK